MIAFGLTGAKFEATGLKSGRYNGKTRQRTLPIP
jgi:hypothetical protein